MKKIIVVRYAGDIDATRKYKVVCNGIVLGKISMGESREFQVEETEQELYVKVDSFRSNIVYFELESGEVKSFECGSSTKTFEKYISDFDLNKYLWIKEIC